jgi:predicted MFS family arabinose efflux permease
VVLRVAAARLPSPRVTEQNGGAEAGGTMGTDARTGPPANRPGGGAAPSLASGRADLTLLALANFTIGFGAFVVVGILPPLAVDFGLDEPTAGWALTTYALVYAVGSPLGVALTGALDRRTVLAGGLALFAAGAMLAAAAPSYGAVLGARATMALGGGLVTPVAATVAIGLAAPEERGRALALVFGGLTLAQAVGVPAGAWAGYAFGWRATFGLAALLSLPIAALVAARLPRGLSVPATSLSSLTRTLRRPDLGLAVGFTVLFMGGVWTVYIYLAALLEMRLGLGRDGVSAMLLVFGAGAVLGNALGGLMTDRIGPGRTLAVLCCAQAVLMPVLTLTGMGPLGTGAVILAWSMAGWSFMVPQQARLAALDPELAPVLFALNASAIYIGAAAGGIAGGAALGAQGPGLLGPAAAILALAALASLPLATRRPAAPG